MKIWSTRRCLTLGITTHHAKTYPGGREWHRTLAAAVHRANQLRSLKIRSLAAQVDRVTALEFCA